MYIAKGGQLGCRDKQNAIRDAQCGRGEVIERGGKIDHQVLEVAPERCDERCERLGRDGIGELGCFRREQHLHAGLVRDEDVVFRSVVKDLGLTPK